MLLSIYICIYISGQKGYLWVVYLLSFYTLFYWFRINYLSQIRVYRILKYTNVTNLPKLL